MESFFWMPAGKKLPGKHGQQDLIAVPERALSKPQAIDIISNSGVARLSL
jgi:hypothetical protein